MTVAELIEKLSMFKPDLRVVVDGYESGYDELSFLTRKIVDQGWSEPTVLGKYDDAYPSEGPDAFEALVLTRYKSE